MTQVLLRDTLETMRARLREGQYADVSALGRHVLRYYPKHIETYRLLAEASLESNDLVAAADLFRRVLSADPENTIALVGLSIVHEQRKELEEAIWHLERAFEIQPTNAELRKELLRLYAEYEGTPRDRLKLTPGGLARLYTRQGLYSQAIQEFRALLRRDSTRADIQTALAETLYRVGRKQEAAETAQGLLEKLPYCLKANLVLGALWSENGVQEAEALLQRAWSLDPEHAVARELLPDHWDDALPPMLPDMSEEAATAAPPDTQPVKPVESAGHDLLLLESLAPELPLVAKTEAPFAPQAPIESAPGVEHPVVTESRAVHVSEPTPASAAGEVAASLPPVAPIEQKVAPAKPAVEPLKEEPVTAPPVQVTEEISGPPLSATEPLSSSGNVIEPKPTRQLLPSLPRIGPTIPGALDKLPAWLRGTAPSVASAGSAPSKSAEPYSPAAAGRLGVLQSPTPVTRVPARIEPAGTDLPEWLTRARHAVRSGELEDNVAASSALEEKPAWLTQADAESPPPDAPTGSPEWLGSESTGKAPDQTRSEDEDSLPVWLDASETGDQVERPAPSSLLPEWLSSPKQEAAPAEADGGTVVPAWLKPSEPEAQPASSTSVPEGIEAQFSGIVQPPAASPQVQTPASLAPQAPTAGVAREMEADETIPEWLREISEAAETEPVAASLVETQRQAPEPVKAEPAAVETSKAEPRAEISAAPTVSGSVRPEPTPPVAETVMPAQPNEKLEAEPDSMIAQARELWTNGDRAGAIGQYEKVLQGGPHFTAEVIADFERFVQEPDVPMPAHRMLGDAYSMVGRFKEALDQYRIVLGR